MHLNHFPTVFPKGFYGAHIPTHFATVICIYYSDLHEEMHNQAEHQPENWIVQNLVVSQNSFWAANLLTQTIPNILISEGGLRTS